MINEFKEFAVRGNVVDMAVGIIIGSAFTAIARSLVDDIIMPSLGLLLADTDVSNFFVVLKAGNPSPPYDSLAAARAAGATTLNYGAFLNSILSFLVVAWATFFLVRALNRIRRRQETPVVNPTTKSCEYCRTSIPIAATRCPNCTSALQEGVWTPLANT